MKHSQYSLTRDNQVRINKEKPRKQKKFTQKDADRMQKLYENWQQMVARKKNKRR